MRKFLSFLLLFYIISFSYSSAETLNETGFIPGQIWYSKSELVEGETVKIYTAIWNNNNATLSAKVEFYDKNVILGTRDVSIPASSLREVYISWKITSGDHLISAKIISPSITEGNKKQSVILERSKTSSDKQFVPVVLNKKDGEVATSSDIIKSQIDKASSSIGDIIPNSIETPISQNINIIDKFRDNTFEDIQKIKSETKEKINSLEEKTKKQENQNIKKSVAVDEATEKPIAYIKMFLLSILSFVFGSKIVFYLLLFFILFLFLRFIYRKIKR